MIKMSWIIFAILLPHLAWGEIIETDHFQDLLPYLENFPSHETIVVFDIDNTLIESSRQLGSVAWGEQMFLDFTCKGIPKKEAMAVIHVLWKCVQKQTKVQLIDPHAPDVIEKIRQRKIPCFALTARFPDEADNTIKQLQSVNLDFSKGHHLAKSITIPLNPQALFQEGVLFGTLDNKKSDVFFYFLDANAIHPTFVLFVDDKLSHLVDLEEACKKRRIACMGIRFSGADHQFRQLNPEIAELQWKALPAYLSDKESLDILSGVERSESRE